MENESVVRTAREIWEYNRDMERLEGVRRCLYCGAREDKHNEPADMRYYGYSAHVFQYPREEEIAEWKLASVTDVCGAIRR